MKFKDYEPIRFEILQSDMERIMFLLPPSLVKDDLQRKIDYHRRIGDWV